MRHDGLLFSVLLRVDLRRTVDGTHFDSLPSLGRLPEL